MSTDKITNTTNRFLKFLNEFELEGEHQSKPLWNGKDYLTADGHIDLNRMGLTEIPVIFPYEWDKNFRCSYNKLTSLQGVPKIIHGNFYCHSNNLESLNDGPVQVDGDYGCVYNVGKKFTEEDVRKVCKVGRLLQV